MWVVQLSAGGRDGHQQRLRLLCRWRARQLHSVRNHIDRGAEIERSDHDRAAAGILAEQRVAQHSQDRPIGIRGAHLDEQLVLARVAVTHEFFGSGVEVLFTDPHAFPESRRHGLVENLHAIAKSG